MNKKKSKPGKVYIVGAGPGDPALITVKGLKALKRADVVLYDFLAGPELLKHVKRSCKRICVGKAEGIHTIKQGGINRLIYENALKHNVTVRLKGGDPFIFSRGHEEATYLKRKGIDFEIVPGVTAGIAVPESAGIPVTLRNVATSVTILTGRKKNPHAAIDAPNSHTLVYFMCVSNIANIVKALKKSGRSLKTPCAFVEKGTYPDQRSVFGTIQDIAGRVKKYNIKAPAILIVGEVAKKSRALFP